MTSPKIRKALLKKLERIANNCLSNAYRSEILPLVMGRYPDALEAQIQTCISKGIDREEVYSTVDRIEKRVYERMPRQKDYPLAQ